MESIVIDQAIRNQKDDLKFFNLLGNFNIGVTLAATYLLSFVGIVLLSLLFNELSVRSKRPIKIRKEIAVILNKFKNKRLSGIGVFFLFIHLFLWFTQLFLTGNMKTKKVVVDTSQLVRRHLSTQNKTI